MPLNHEHLFGPKRKRSALDLLVASFALVALVLLALVFTTSAAHADDAAAASPSDAATSTSGGAGFQATPATTPGLRAKIAADGRTAIPPEGAPLAVKQAIWAANKITRKPYIYGGGHATYKKISKGYDCSGTVSYALGNAGLLKTGPLDSSSFLRWGAGGKGAWVTVFTNPGHAYAYIAGLRLDTSGAGEEGPRWRTDKRSDSGFRARHPQGF
jgi:cell wall-associated NlpC family hydrolase